MKYILTIFFFCNLQLLNAQAKMDTIDVAFDKTIILIFPDSISFDDLGNPHYKAEKVGNRYKLATDGKVKHSSLYIELKNGYYYSFILRFNNKPPYTVKTFNVEQATGRNMFSIDKRNSSIADEKKNEPTTSIEENKELEQKAELVIRKPATNISTGIEEKRIQFILESIYIHNDKIYIKLTSKNLSNIDYGINFIYFYTSTKKEVLKANAAQDNLLEPLYVHNQKKMIKAKSEISQVFVFNKFTIGDKKKLYIEMHEKGGERELTINLTSKDILNASMLREN